MQTAPPSCLSASQGFILIIGKAKTQSIAGLISGHFLQSQFLPWQAAYADHHHCLQAWGRHFPGALKGDGTLSHFLAPNLATHLETKLGEILSWNFSLEGWDKILLTGKQLGVWVGPKTNRSPEEDG